MNARARNRSGGASWLRPENRRIILMVVGVGVVAFLLMYGVTALAFNTGGAPADVAMVPDVREMTVTQASRAMAREGLIVEVGDSFPNAGIPAGAVLAQSPLPGQEVSPGIAVRLIVSTGPLRPTVPDVQSMPLALATRALQTAGFDVLVEEAEGEGEPGRVVDTQPAAGSAIELPATVRLRIGTAGPAGSMPSLIGMLEADAQQVIADMGLETGNVVYEESQFGEPGGVVGQEPAPGDSVRIGDTVRLRVTPAFDFGRDQRIDRENQDDRNDRDDRDDRDQRGDRFDREPPQSPDRRGQRGND